jgi:serine/threonine protein kinase
MQYIDGRPLDEAARCLGLEQKVALVRTVAEAVHAAHAAGLVHRDLKPANILVERTEDGELKPWVVDFGIAREHAVEGATVTGQVLGTPGYLSPEQAHGEVSTIDRRSDVFSLGVVLYELLCGGRPHAGDSDIEALVSLLAGEVVPLRKRAPHLPRDLETVVMTCLEHDRERRYGSRCARGSTRGSPSPRRCR